MSDVTIDRRPAPSLPPEALQALIASIRKDSSLPVPPGKLASFVGDGDYLAVGTHFLEKFVALGGLRPDARVIDIGCGIGRIAVPLTQYLGTDGRYLGLDVTKAGIDWCTENIAARYPNFAFKWLDLNHPIYNRRGTGRTAEVRVPEPDGSADFIILTSVFTHLERPEAERYLDEIARLLTPNGLCFATFFLIDAESRESVATGQARFSFDLGAPGPAYIHDRQHPTAAVAYHRAWLIQAIAARGLDLARPIYPGTWRGPQEPKYSFQDICLIARAP